MDHPQRDTRSKRVRAFQNLQFKNPEALNSEEVILDFESPDGSRLERPGATDCHHFSNSQRKPCYPACLRASNRTRLPCGIDRLSLLKTGSSVPGNMKVTSLRASFLLFEQFEWAADFDNVLSH